jgi:hypothetical protein
MIWWTERYKVAMTLVVFAIGLMTMYACHPANAHDLSKPELDKWFQGLSSPNGGLCCDGRDAKELDDSDWDTKDNHYRVRLNGEWYDVPDNAVVKEKNLVGRALVWVLAVPMSSYVAGRRATIKCFLPGTWS